LTWHAASLAESPQAQTVIEVRVEGNVRMSRAAILSLIQTRVGQPYNEEVVKGDERRLLRSRHFTSVVVTRTQLAEDVVVTFTVVERPVVAQVVFVGNKELSDAALARELMFGQRDPVLLATVRAGRQALLNRYRAEGFAFATVTLDQQALRKDNIVRYRIVEGPKVRIGKIIVEGNRFFSTLRLKALIGVSARFWPFIAGTYDAEQVQRDILAIRDLYISEGFLAASVDVLRQFSDDKKRVTLRYVIDEGRRYRVARIIFRGNTVFSDEELSRRLKLARGNFVVALTLRRDTRRLEDTYGELGYIQATVTVRKVYHAPDEPPPPWARDLDAGRPALLDLVFTIEESDQFTIGRIDIRGNDITEDRVIRRELRFYPEQIYNTRQVEDSRRRLVELALFEDVKVTPTGREPGRRDVLVQVVEGKTAQFLIGVGVNTNQGLVGSVSFRQRNFNLFGWPKSLGQLLRAQAFKGAGQTFSLVAEPGTELMRFYVDWFEPYVFDLPYSLNTRAFLFTRERESYDETRYGGVVSVGHLFRNRWYGELSGRIEGVEIEDLKSDAPPEVLADAGSHLMVGIKGTLVRDRTDSRWLPSRGDRIHLSYEQVVGDFNFGQINASYRIYRTLYTDALGRKHIIAGRFAIGHIFGDAPVFERFFGGGIGSVRGFEYRGISPRSAGTDEPIGGETMLFAGAEYSFPLVAEQMRGVFFVDAGTVEEDFSVETVRVAVGFGLRWTVPLFGPVPMTFDFGFPVVKQDEDETQVFSFTIGWIF
jgi:outer membrane protein assembly complex protein YaeT